MKRSRSIVKIVAVVSSVLLAGLYVYDRAGGNLLERLYPAASTKNEPRAMSSSKMKALVPAMQMHAEKQKLMPGPKYAPVFSKPFSEPAVKLELSTPTEETRKKELMFSGSKSSVHIIPPPDLIKSPAPQTGSQKEK